jgi:hypothetical protein
LHQAASMARRILGLGVVLVLSLVPRPAHAACATEEDGEVCKAHDIFFMPGVAGLFYSPKGVNDPFFGGGVQLAPYHWSHNNDHFGPSQGAIYFEAAILQSSSQSSSLAIYDLGFSLSLERNSSRIWLIPYFGSNVGGISSTELPKSGFLYPFLGLHLLWHQNLVFDVEGGYHFPFESIDVLRGPRMQITARFSMW